MFKECLICKSQSLKPLRGYERHFLVKCLSCSFVFSRHQPSSDELQRHYAGYPRETEISDITWKRYEALLDHFERYRTNGNLIDVGCGDGFFLIAAKKRNWNVYGTEYTADAIANCARKGIEMTASPLDADRYAPGFFDVVTSFEVLEHINTPLHETASFHAILRNGGLLYLTTPNFNSVSRTILGSKWNVIEYPEHLSYYTPATVTRLLKGAGFVSRKLQTTGVSLSRLGASSGISAPVKKWDEQVRQQSEQHGFFKMVKAFINFALDITGKGDSLKAWFEKSNTSPNH